MPRVKGLKLGFEKKGLNPQHFSKIFVAGCSRPEYNRPILGQAITGSGLNCFPHKRTAHFMQLADECYRLQYTKKRTLV